MAALLNLFIFYPTPLSEKCKEALIGREEPEQPPIYEEGELAEVKYPTGDILFMQVEGIAIKEVLFESGPERAMGKEVSIQSREPLSWRGGGFRRSSCQSSYSPHAEA